MKLNSEILNKEAQLAKHAKDWYKDNIKDLIQECKEALEHGCYWKYSNGKYTFQYILSYSNPHNKFVKWDEIINIINKSLHQTFIVDENRIDVTNKNITLFIRMTISMWNVVSYIHIKKVIQHMIHEHVKDVIQYFNNKNTNYYTFDIKDDIILTKVQKQLQEHYNNKLLFQLNTKHQMQAIKS